MAYVPNSGSVLAFQGTVPWSVLGGNQSISGTVTVANLGSSIIAIPGGVQSVAGTITANQGTTPWVITGSVQGSFSPSGNQSVSGTVGASVIGNVPTTITSIATVGGFLNVNLVGGSILTSSTPNQSVSGTVQADIRGSIAAVIIGGSVAVATGNSSVQVLNFPTTQNISGSVFATGSITALQGTNPWIVTSSIAGGIFPVSGSVAAVVSNFPTTQNISGSVVATQGTTPYVVNFQNSSIIALQSGSVVSINQGSVAVVIIGGSILTSSTPNQSVSGTIGASIIGLPPVNVTNFPTTQNVSGSVVAFQGGTWVQSVVGQGAATALTNGWPVINGEANDVTGTFTNATQTTSITANNLDGYGNSLISINGTYGTATAIFEGSDDGGTTWYTVEAARDDSPVIETGYTSLTNISRTWQINNSGFDSIRVRSTAVASGTANIRISSSAAPNASGAVVAIGSALPSGTNMLGSVAAYQGSIPWAIGSVYGNISGSVAAFQQGTWNVSIAALVGGGGTVPIKDDTQFGDGVTTGILSETIRLFNNAGTYDRIRSGSVAGGLLGTYAEDVASSSGDTGFLTFGVRNDTVASLVNANSDYGAFSQDSAGRQLTKPFAAEEAVLRGNGSVNGAASIQLLAAGGTGLKTYLTDVTIANTGATTTLVNFTDGDASIIGRTMAPSGGGSNLIGLTVPIVTMKTNTPINMVAVTATSVLYGSAQGFKAP